MKKLRELLRLKFESKLSHRQIGSALNLSPGTISYYVQAAVACKLSWPLPDDYASDAALSELLEPEARQLRQRTTRYVMPDWAAVNRDLQNRHVTLMVLWEAYRAEHGSRSYSYAQFTRHYKRWSKNNKVSLRMLHAPGEKGFVDYAGATLPVYCRTTGKVLFNAQLFIMVLGASDYTFAYATRSQAQSGWCYAHAKAFEFFGGAPKILVPDNLKSGVTDSCCFEPTINRAYADLAEHYGAAVIPARPRKPQDKSKAENGVQVAQRWLVTRLDKNKYYSLNALNNAISDLLDSLNSKPFQKREGSRLSQFQAREKAALKPLPPSPYEFAQFFWQTVTPDYHVRVDRHHYSVPYTLIGERVLIRYTQTMVEIWHDNQRQASHLRAFLPDEKTTQAAHMPKAHQKYQAWTPQVFIDWAAHIGQPMVNVAARIVSGKKHPEQVHKIYHGFKKLNKTYGSNRLDTACRRAIALECVSFKSIQSILKHGLDKQPFVQPVNSTTAPDHANLRGSDYYRLAT